MYIKAVSGIWEIESVVSLKYIYNFVDLEYCEIVCCCSIYFDFVVIITVLLSVLDIVLEIFILVEKKTIYSKLLGVSGI